MKQRFIDISILFIIILCLSACSSQRGTPSGVSGESAETTVTTAETTEVSALEPEYEDGSRTLLVYMCGSSLETKNGSATKNLAEMLSASLTEKTRLVIETGGTKTWRRYDIPNGNCRYEIESGELKQLERLDTKSMGNAQTLAEFLAWGIDAYPAEKYSLIIWDHGGGSVKGVCSDELFDNDSLTLSELDTALSDGLRDYGGKLEFIGFDACLMATVENAMVASRYAENMLASQELEPAGGWDYGALLPKLGDEDFYRTVLDSYSEKSARSSDYFTLSHIDLSKLSAVTDMFGALVEKLKNEPLQVTVVSALSKAMTFGTSGGGSTDLYDLGNLLEYFAVDGKLSACIEEVGSETRSAATGLSVYFPLNNPSFLDEYSKLNPFDFYSEYLAEFFSYRANETISFLSYDTGAIENNRFSFVLTPESMNYLREAKYFVYAVNEDDEAHYLALGWDNDVEIDKNTITVLFEGNWVEFGGQLLLCEPMESSGTVTVFQGLICVDGEEAIMLFSFDSATNEADIIGVTYRSDNFSRIYDIPQNAQIDVVSQFTSLTSAEREELGTYSTEFVVYPDDSFLYNDDTTVRVVRLPDGIYQYTAAVTDIYGKTFIAGTVDVRIADGEASIIDTATDLVGTELY